MMKKGHKRKNWTERWFLLKPNSISYYVSEDLAEKKGDILLDGNCCVEARNTKRHQQTQTTTVNDNDQCSFIHLNP
jgi:hypothetical protein